MRTDWGERDDEEYGDWYEPTGGQTDASVRWSEHGGIGRVGAPMHPIGGRLYGAHDLVMIKDEERAKDDDDEADSVIDCKRSMSGTKDGKDGDELRYFFVNILSL